MGLRTGLDLEGPEDFDYSMASSDGKGISDIAMDIRKKEDSLINELAKMHNIDVSPFSMIPVSKEEFAGPWQNPDVLLQAANRLYQVLEKEGNDLLGKEIADKKVTLRQLNYYKLALYDVIKFCKIASEKNKRVRFMLY